MCGFWTEANPQIFARFFILSDMLAAARKSHCSLTISSEAHEIINLARNNMPCHALDVKRTGVAKF